jgi:hypothetical protein
MLSNDVKSEIDKSNTLYVRFGQGGSVMKGNISRATSNPSAIKNQPDGDDE